MKSEIKARKSLLINYSDRIEMLVEWKKDMLLSRQIRTLDNQVFAYYNIAQDVLDHKASTIAISLRLLALKLSLNIPASSGPRSIQCPWF